MGYLKDKSYKIKYADKSGKVKEIEVVPETNMNKVQMITKLKNENNDFLKLVENKQLNPTDKKKLIKAMEVLGFYYDYIDSYDGYIKFQTSGASLVFKNWNEVEEYLQELVIEDPDESDAVEKILNEEKELLLEDNSNTITSQEGFYIGDPCYVLSDERYDQWDNKYGYQDGVIEIDGYKFIVHGTAYGDGEYFSNINGVSFGVDSGTLAVIPLELVSQIDVNLDVIPEGEFENGYIIKGDTASLEYDKGIFTFKIDEKTIEIYTNNEDDDEWYDCSDDEENY